MSPVRPSMFVLIMVLIACIARGQVPSDDCTSGPVSAITTLPFANAGTLFWNNDVNFGVDLGAACGAGRGGTPTGEGGDFVYQITLGPGHNVDCSLFTAPEPFNTSDWVFVLSNSCETPLGAGACAWGEVVPEMDTGAFNTAALGLAPGTYYLWFDREPCCPAWQIECSGFLSGPEEIFSDGFESGNTSAWTSQQPPP